MRIIDFHYNVPLDANKAFPSIWDCYKTPSKTKVFIYYSLCSEFFNNEYINVLDYGIYTHNRHFFTFVCDYLDLKDRTFKRTIVYPNRRVTTMHGSVDG